MKSIKLNHYHLSQFHAGQMIDLDASIFRWIDGTWYSVRGRHDRSTREGWEYEVNRHKTEKEADRAATVGLVISSERWTTYDLDHANRVEKLLERYGWRMDIEFVLPDKAKVTIGRETETVFFEEIDAAVVRLARLVCVGTRFGTYYPNGEFQENRKKTEQFKREMQEAGI